MGRGGRFSVQRVAVSTQNEEKTMIEIGDRITFRALTVWSDRKVVRKVNGFRNGDRSRPTVRFGGYADYTIKDSEISKVEKD